jgi:hydrogenase maturation factor
MRIVRFDGDLALCASDDDATEAVAVDLVAPVSPGDRVLVHAGVAIGLAEPA